MNLKISKKAKKQIERLRNSNQKLANKIIKSIYLIQDNPYRKNVIKLKGVSGHRFRVKNYRIFYRIDTKDKIVTIASVLHRKDAYKNLENI